MWQTFLTESVIVNFTIYGWGNILGDIFTKASVVTLNGIGSISTCFLFNWAAHFIVTF
jgi:hypothetical protein